MRGTFVFSYIACTIFLLALEAYVAFPAEGPEHAKRMLTVKNLESRMFQRKIGERYIRTALFIKLSFLRRAIGNADMPPLVEKICRNRFHRRSGWKP
jgi:hypothetical protein